MSKQINTTGWMDKAACKDMDREVFFPLTVAESLKARRVCYECPVRRECLEYAINDPYIYGVWGGLTEKQRRRVRLNRRGDY
jgi:WhiB family redox-sensing transcriptional regulator